LDNNKQLPVLNQNISMSISAGILNNQKRFYGILVTILFIFSLVGGLVGFRNYFMLQEEEFNWLKSIYCTLQLFTLESGDLKSPIPLILNIARFTAPLTTVMTFIIALLEIFRDRWMRIKIAKLNNHVVIIGFGTKGKHVMKESLKKNEKVLIIERDPLNPNLESIKSSRCSLLIGDATNKNILRKANISKAKAAFLLMENDTDQVNTCMHIYQLLMKSDRGESNSLSCIMHLQNQKFLTPMRTHNLIQDTHDGFELNIFNVYENSAREMFETSPPDRMGILVDSKKYVQIFIIGFGQAGEALALQTAFTGHYVNGLKPQIVIVDRLANEKIPNFLERHPSFTEFCNLEFLSLDANSPQLIQHLIGYLEDPNALNTIVLCFDNNVNNMLLGLQFESLKINADHTPPEVFARTSESETFSTFSENIKPYGLPSKVSSHEVIVRGNLDKKAKAIHNSYLNKRKEVDDFGAKDADADWANLSQEYKDSNRKVADHLGIKMRGIGCEIVDKNDPRPSVVFSTEEIELLSELEHRRWSADRSLAGWTYGEQKNSKTRKTPYLTNWHNLAEEVKDFDRNVVKSIPEILTLVGLKAVKK
jgi:hypothetical protein